MSILDNDKNEIKVNYLETISYYPGLLQGVRHLADTGNEIAKACSISIETIKVLDYKEPEIMRFNKLMDELFSSLGIPADYINILNYTQRYCYSQGVIPSFISDRYINNGKIKLMDIDGIKIPINTEIDNSDEGRSNSECDYNCRSCMHCGLCDLQDEIRNENGGNDYV